MGNKGHSERGLFGSYTQYYSNNKPVGSTAPGFFGGYSHSSSESCYIATCVYGSWDCPEGMALRSFRDKTLGRSAFDSSVAKVPLMVHCIYYNDITKKTTRR